MSQVVQQEALTRLVLEKGILSKEGVFSDGGGYRPSRKNGVTVVRFELQNAGEKK